MGRKSKKNDLDCIEEESVSDLEVDSDTNAESQLNGPGFRISRAFLSRGSRMSSAAQRNTIFSQLEDSYSKIKEDSLSSDKISALRQLAFLFSISSEEDLFGCDSLISEIGVELIHLLKRSDDPEESLLAIRSIANIIEAQPGIQYFFVRNDLVASLCSQLLQLQDIDIADQALSTLEVISRNFPIHVIEADGLSAAMLYIDFFTISSQRTALQILAHSIPSFSDSNFDQMLQLIPSLSKTSTLFDEKVVELSWSCIEFIVKKIDSPSILDSAFTPDLIDLALSQLSSSKFFTLRDLLLRILSSVSKKSIKSSLHMLDSGVIDSIYNNFSEKLDAQKIDEFFPDLFKKSSPSPLNSNLSNIDEIQILDFIEGFLPPLIWVASFREGDPESSFSLHPKNSDFIHFISYLEEKPALSFQLSSLLIYISINVIRSNPSSLILGKSVASFLLSIYLFDQKNVITILSLYNLHDFSSWLLSQSQSRPDAIQIAALVSGYRLLSFAPEIYKDLYIRQGSVQALKKIAKKPFKNVKPKIIIQGLEILRDFQNQSPSDKKKESSYAKKSDSWSKKMASLILEKYFGGLDSLNDTAVSSSIISDLTISQNEIRQIWKNCTNGYDQIQIIQHLQVLELHLSEDKGITAYELEQSGWLKLLSDVSVFLSESLVNGHIFPKSEKVDLSLLIYRFFSGTNASRSPSIVSVNLNSLLGILHDSLDVVDTFPTFVPERSGSDLKDNPLTYLSRSIKVELECLDILDVFEPILTQSDEFKEFMTFKLQKYLKAFDLTLLSTVNTNSLFVYSKPRILQALSKSYSSYIKSFKSTDSETQNNSPFPNNSRKSLFFGSDGEVEAGLSLEDILLLRSESSVAHASNIESDEHDFMDLEFPSSVEDIPNEQVNHESSSTIISHDIKNEPDSVCFNPSEFSLEFYLKNVDEETVKLDQTDSLFLSLLNSKFEYGKQGYSQFNPWSNRYKVYYKIVFGSQIAKASEDNTESFTKKMSYSFITKRSIKSTPSSVVSDVIKNPDSRVTQIFSEKFQNILNVFSALYYVHFLDSVNSASGYDLVSNSDWNHPFLNKKLSGKLETLLNDPFTVSTRGFPFWVAPLTYKHFYLFSFETRYKFMRISFLPISRNLSKWKSSQNSYSAGGPGDHLLSFSRSILGLPMVYRLDNGEMRISSDQIIKQKILINRDKAFESARLTMLKFAGVDNILEFQFVDEVGTGLGPTLELYSSVCAGFLRKDLNIWYTNGDKNFNDSDSVFISNGLFPLPINSQDYKITERYEEMFSFIGLFVAKSIIDERPIDLPIHPFFFLLLLGSINDKKLSSIDPIEIVSSIDPVLAKSLVVLRTFNSKSSDNSSFTDSQDVDEDSVDSSTRIGFVEDLGLDFTFPGNPDYLLRPNGHEISVNKLNLNLYLELIYDAFVGRGIHLAISGFKAGFSKLLPVETLCYYSIDELSIMFGFNSDAKGANQSAEDDAWSAQSLSLNIVADHGYSSDSPAFKMFVDWLSGLDRMDRRKFLNFVTGAPRLPHSATLYSSNRAHTNSVPSPSKSSDSTSGGRRASGVGGSKKSIAGFGALSPPLTVVLRHSSHPLSPDDYLPTVMTCANYIKLPNYSSIEVLDKRWRQAIDEGSFSFHLS
ncbi:putative ubiquitin fusion degradation protein [Smittium mucronatum]|uniref:HECT-type E3 ubiquitin transferase n=1 Tax=Smittium mucronatum TaxID=133383 RepID=A0A1R0GXP4_9FUNG|nr:putative ubiquitin fusion degradation protein [Smittium mucronatum]